MNSLSTFLNSGVGLIIVGALIGAIGLFTWQRRDWLFKQKHGRAEVMLDRQLDLIERINADVGRLLATATGSVVVIKKQGPKEQVDDAINDYNNQQIDWFSAYSSYEALLVFYFSNELSELFTSKIVGAYEKADPQISNYSRNPNNENYAGAYHALENIRQELRSWNAEAFKSLPDERVN